MSSASDDGIILKTNGLDFPDLLIGSVFMSLVWATQLYWRPIYDDLQRKRFSIWGFSKLALCPETPLDGADIFEIGLHPTDCTFQLLSELQRQAS
jgi:hypothetical protein